MSDFMSKASPQCWVRQANLFVISITLLLIIGCASHSSAPVLDKSKSLSARPKTHVVIPGDTLFSIAWRYGLKYEVLAKYNGITPPYIIRPSQVIRLDVTGAEAVTKSPRQNVAASNSYPSKSNSKPSAAAAKTAVARQENKTKNQTVVKSKSQVWKAPQWRWPVKGPLLSAFQGNNALNKGIDLGGKLGEPVLAAADGQVVYSGNGLRGYGKLLIVKHNETFLSAYAHNDRLLVKEGDTVKAGQRIADMGSSGTDRVKLHFEIRRDGTPVDPIKFLPRR